MNEQTWMLFGGIGALLLLASLVGFVSSGAPVPARTR